MSNTFPWCHQANQMSSPIMYYLPWYVKTPETLAIPEILWELVQAILWLMTPPAENPMKYNLLFLALSKPISWIFSTLWSITLFKNSSSFSNEKQQVPPFHVCPQIPRIKTRNSNHISNINNYDYEYAHDFFIIIKYYELWPSVAIHLLPRG